MSVDSDMGLEQLEAVGAVFVEAHHLVPGGLSVEVGTRTGGSALYFLRLLNTLYRVKEEEPSLFTVDPYGYKPYDSGIPNNELMPIYGHAEYSAMKTALAPFPNHAHFLMESLEFFARMRGAHYWELGEKSFTTPSQPGEFALGVQKQMGDLTFCLLDGDHSSSVILRELTYLTEWMHPKGLVVVDNVECDPKTIPALERQFKAEIRTAQAGNKWAIVRGVKQ